MLNEKELRDLLADLESDRAERTVTTKNTEKFSEAICAFSNDFPNHKLPGYLEPVFEYKSPLQFGVTIYKKQLP